VSGNAMSHFDCNRYKNCANLKRINLDNNKLLFLDLELFKPAASSLRYLSVVNSRVNKIFSAVPAIVVPTNSTTTKKNTIAAQPWQFSNLVHLDLSNNKIEAVDNQLLSKTPNLEYLNVENNEISVWASLSTALPRLRTLILSNNQLESEGMPKLSEQIKNLEHLYVNGNRLTEVPRIRALSNLATIDVSAQKDIKEFGIRPFAFYRVNATRKLGVNMAQFNSSSVEPIRYSIGSFCSGVPEENHISYIKINTHKYKWSDTHCYLSQINGADVQEVNMVQNGDQVEPVESEQLYCSCTMVNFLAQKGITMSKCALTANKCVGYSIYDDKNYAANPPKRSQQCGGAFTYDCSDVQGYNSPQWI
jgi:hypothetical protein